MSGSTYVGHFLYKKSEIVIGDLSPYNVIFMRAMSDMFSRNKQEQIFDVYS